MRKTLITFIACLAALPSFTQEPVDKGVIIDWKEDSTDVTTINDIINIQQEVSSRTSTGKHFIDVWSHRSYANFSYNTASLDPKFDAPADNSVAKYKSNWGASFQYGRSYRLHKTPIANVAQFCIDYTGIDLNINHFKQDGGYNSASTITDGEKTYYYTPWNLEKFEFNYGMSIGPSVTFAPFTYLDIPELHFLKLRLYYHIGYHASVLSLKSDEDVDRNTVKTDNAHIVMADNLKLDWGHGLMQSFGFDLSWKFIGIGYEHRWRSIKYKAFTTTDFGSDSYKFDGTTNRIYLSIRMGR